MIETIHGPMPEAALIKVVTTWNRDTESGEAVEYHYGGQIVHRSAAVQLKLTPELAALMGALGG